jgi:hypothetical protein
MQGDGKGGGSSGADSPRRGRCHARAAAPKEGRAIGGMRAPSGCELAQSRLRPSLRFSKLHRAPNGRTSAPLALHKGGIGGGRIAFLLQNP